MKDAELHELIWSSGFLTIRIEVAFTPDWVIYEHLGITSIEPERTPLPITPTGYKSVFLPQGTVAKNGGPIETVRQILDEAAALPEWQEHLAKSRQGSLF